MAQKGQVYWNRVGYVEVEDANGNMIAYPGLDFKFNITKFGHIYTEFDVSILGLSFESIKDLTVLGPQQAFQKRRQIRVYAGYGDKMSDAVEIARGCIWYAKPTNPPEMWMNFKCRKWLDADVIIDGQEPVDKESTRWSCFQRIAQILDLTPKWEAQRVDKDKEIGVAFSFNGHNKLHIPDAFADRFGVIVYEDDGCLIAKDKDIAENGGGGNTHMLNMNNGLLAIGNIDLFGGDITARLNDSYKLMDWIQLQSLMIPDAKAKYLIVSKNLVGHLRGDEWFTRYQLIREQK